MTTSEDTQQRKRRLAWRMVMLCFFVQNCASGLTFGSYGTILINLQNKFESSRAAASLGLSMVMLAIGLLSPVVGYLLHRISIRKVMIAGALLNAVAYLLLSKVTSIYELYAVYTLVGIGVSLAGVIAPATLVSRWFDKNRGRALGIISIPAFIFLTPILSAKIMLMWGLSAVFLAIALTHVVSGIACLFLKDWPDEVADTSKVPEQKVTPPLGLAQRPVLHVRAIFTDPAFWLLALANGLLTGGAQAYLVHFVPFAVWRGYPLQTAVGVMSAYGFAGIAGTYIYGWIADRAGAVQALVIDALLQALAWGTLTVVMGVPFYFGLTAVIGAGMTATAALQAAAFTQLFGVENVSRVLGFSYFFKIPFIFGAAPVAGLLYDMTGGYTVPFVGFAVTFVLTALIFAMLAVMDGRRRAAAS